MKREWDMEKERERSRISQFISHSWWQLETVARRLSLGLNQMRNEGMPVVNSNSIIPSIVCLWRGLSQSLYLRRLLLLRQQTSCQQTHKGNSKGLGGGKKTKLSLLQSLTCFFFLFFFKISSQLLSLSSLRPRKHTHIRKSWKTCTAAVALGAAQKHLWGMNQEINSFFLSNPLKGAKES